ncbi:DUF3455 domain-containing protein [Paraburkholderia tropica]|uniref:DUF3455 domain-containing protein n=1 Tax=Paraburkholderia tropica TaxID=92647 RepID=A0AAQ1GLJ3_9BURK|nr:DUF3455 domain-containing protein [Paraburkholderia tropica]RQN35249.1 DUF3455 domain-containing protein [Paraburkholderia tropica]SEK10045.1 Protein of unknown function [Paraburkholderia tropica]
MIRLSRVTRAIGVAGAMGMLAAGAAHAQSIDAPNAQQVLSTMASGVQIYTCEYGADHTLGWVFQQPHAKLYDAHGAAVIEHSAGPSWVAPDGSRIEGKVMAQQPSATPGSVPQLLLQTHSTGAAGLLASVRYVQRINTVGGAKPPAPCTSEHESGSSPYLATYVFYQ